MSLGDREVDAREYGRPRRPVVRFDAIGEAWRMVMLQLGTWALTALVVVVANGVVSGAVASSLGMHHAGGMGGFRWRIPTAGTAVYVVLTSIVTGFFVGGMFRMACRQLRGERIGVADLFDVVDVIGELVLGSALYAAAVMVASLFCFVIPGLIVHGLLMFTFPLIVDARLAAPAALATSWNALKGQWLTATLFHLVVAFLSGLGTLFCCVGLLVTAPLYVLSIAILYRDFFAATGATHRDKKPAPPHGDF